MRVTLVTETYAPQVNGVSRTLGQLARVLTDSGDQVQVVHPDYGDPPGDDLAVLVRSIPLPFYPELRLPLPPFGDVLQAIDHFNPDLIHIATEATLGHAALRHALDRKIPVVSSFHTNFDQYAGHYGVGWIKGTVWRYLRWFHNSTLETYTPSLATIADLKEKGLERLVLWPRGVDGSLFRPDRPGRETVRRELGFADDDVVIGHVSRIAAEKNVAYLGEALALVESARPSVRLLIVGDGPARGDLETKLGDAAKFAGYRTGDDLADHYAAADLFAFASLTETFGNVVLEAMAERCPVVVTAEVGAADIVRESGGGAVLDGDPVKLGAGISALIADRVALKRMGERGREFVSERYTWDAVCLQMEAAYRQVIAG